MPLAQRLYSTKPLAGVNVGQSAIAPLRPRQFTLALLGLVLLWPAIVNGYPFFFPDTGAYVRGVDAAVVRLTDHRTSWSNADVLSIARRPSDAATGAPTRSPPGPASAAGQPKPVLLGRSVFYGAIAYTGALTGSFWLTIALQALLAGAVIIGFIRHFVDPREERRFAAAAAISTAGLALTPLSWFVSMVMPDFLTGALIVAATALIVGWGRETKIGRAFWIAIAAFAALAHSSHALMLLGLAVAAFVLSLFGLRRWRPGAMAVAASAMVGLLGEVAFAAVVTSTTGASPIRPPFITARLVEDGPGLDFLASHCGHAQFHLCRYRDRLPLPSDSFLWSKDRATGVFGAVATREQRALAGEQAAFVGAVVIDRPLVVVQSSGAAILRQFASWRLPEFNNDDRQDAQEGAAKLPAAEKAGLLSSRFARGTMPTGWTELLIPFWSLAGLISIIWLVKDTRLATVSQYGVVLIAGWLLDVAICGALSTPHDRYQARAIWVLAFGALTIALTRRGPAQTAVRLGRRSPGV
ncbi:hypothetical protein [uncultured Sphingomonas sp.]|uniref:hypothetical protein n=1 Tax=uncultured Sphingomonas sp. TaxID=158754 RepID=UPI0035CA9260